METSKTRPRENSFASFDPSCPLAGRINSHAIYCKYRPSILQHGSESSLATIVFLPCDCSAHAECERYELTQNDM